MSVIESPSGKTQRIKPYGERTDKLQYKKRGGFVNRTKQDEVRVCVYSML